MEEVHIRILDAGKDNWTAELWSGFPGAASGVKLAGSGAIYTLAQLDRDDDQIAGLKLDKTTILDKIRTEEQPSQIFTRAGARLYELLEVTGVAAEWQKMRAAGDLRTYLDTPDSISERPWELLAWQRKQNLYGYAFNSKPHPVMRVSQPVQPDATWEDSTVRILLVSGDEELDPAGGFKASEELRLIRKIFHDSGLSVLVQMCERPESITDLEKAINNFQPHILHFIGHGEIDDDPGAEFHLVFKKTTTWEWSTQQILNFFSNSEWKPRLVLLNACHTARFDFHAASVAAALLTAGIPAVIGAQAALRVDYARYFAEEFYRALAASESTTLDEAMRVARDELSKKPQYQGLNRRHWALPILTVAAPPPEILKFKRVHTQVMACVLVRDLFTRPGRCIDRVADRHSLVSAFQPPIKSQPGYRGVILSGGSAKSWLVKRSIRDFLDAGFLVRYATLVGPEAGRSLLDVLQDWRGRPALNSFMLDPIPGPHFDDFDALCLQARQAPTAILVQEIFTAFKQGLQKARGPKQKVLLILDRFRDEKGSAPVAGASFRAGLMEQLFLPLQQGAPELEGVYALLVAREYTGPAAGARSDIDEFGLAQLDRFDRKTVKEFPKEEVDNLFDEFSDFTTNDETIALRMLFHARFKQPWSPEELKLLDQVIVQALK